MPLKKCKACQTAIDAKARICPICKKSFEWSGVIQTISLYAGTTIALFSLASIGYESFTKIVEREKADLILNVAKLNNDQFNIVVSNKGRRSAVVYDLTISYPPIKECKQKISINTERVEFESKVIEPGKTYNISVSVKNLYKAFAGFDPQVLSNEKLMKNLGDYKVCSAHITYLDFDGTHKPQEVSFYCGPQSGC